MYFINGKGHKSELRSYKNYLTNPYHVTSYLWPGGGCTCTHTYPHELCRTTGNIDERKIDEFDEFLVTSLFNLSNFN